MKKQIFILLAVILFLPLNSVFAEWQQVGQGMYVADFAKNGNFLTYSTKIDKTSSLWQQYLTAHNFSQANMGNFNSMVIKATYDCSMKRIMVNSVQLYDSSGNQMGAFVDQIWQNDPNGSGSVLCSQLK